MIIEVLHCPYGHENAIVRQASHLRASNVLAAGSASRGTGARFSSRMPTPVSHSPFPWRSLACGVYDCSVHPWLSLGGKAAIDRIDSGPSD